MSSGLACLHRNNIIHGDLKAANILLNDELRPVLCDLGLSKNLEDDSQSTSTSRDGGSLRWMSPERLRDRVSSTRQSDIYSLGMTIVEVSTRTPVVAIGAEM